MPGSDRIAELVLGHADADFTARARREAEARLEWMRTSVVGTRVIDVGCSQGILARDLARDGYEVVGVDVDASALAYARELAAAEDDRDRARISWVRASAEHVPVASGSVDSLVLGEVLEHLPAPKRAVAEAARVLVDGGVLVGSVPFGWTGHDDHVDVVFLSAVREWLRDDFDVEELRVVEKRIRFRARRREAKETTAGDGFDPDGETRDAVVSMERQYYLPRIADLRREVERLRRARAEAEAGRREAERRARELEGERDAARADAARLVASPRLELGTILALAGRPSRHTWMAPIRLYRLWRKVRSAPSTRRDRRQIEAWFRSGSGAAVDGGIESAWRRRPRRGDALARAAFIALRELDPARALAWGERAHARRPDPALARSLRQRHLRQGNLARARSLAREAGDLRSVSSLDAQLALLERGFGADAPLVASRIDPVRDRALYLLHNSLPHASGGYAARTHGLLSALRGQGVDVRGVTRLGFPQDRHRGKDLGPLPEESRIDGVLYRRLFADGDGYGEMPIDRYLARYEQRLLELVSQERPAVLHAASNYMNGVVANRVGRAAGIPTIYEVRGLWEVTRISRQPEWEGSEAYRVLERMETDAARGASLVFAITRALRDEMVRRGVPEERIRLLPNAVDPERFHPRGPDADVLDRWGLRGKVVIGFVGSLVDYEGLDDFFEALPQVLGRASSPVHVLVVGDGDARERLERLVADRGLGRCVSFTGRVPHRDVERHLSVVDVVPFPRKPVPVCEMVSPLKPFEAMAMEKAVLATDVAALAEIVDDGVTGVVVRKGDPAALVDGLVALVDDADLRARLGRAARRWIVAERNWKRVAAIVAEAYRELEAERAP